MDHTHLLLRSGEIFLKGRNRKFFEKLLRRNIRKIANIETKQLRGRLIAPYAQNHSDLQKVFGLTSYSPAIAVDKDIKLIAKTAIDMITGSTFRVASKRSDKSFPSTSPEINRTIGEYIEEHSNFTFSFENPETTIHIEINQDGAYLYTEVIRCFGGLPVGCEGSIPLLVENNNSILAGILMMKRGCHIEPICLEKQDISLLAKYSARKIMCEIVEKVDSDVLVVGQTFDEFATMDGVVLRPLIGYSDDEIKEMKEEFKHS